jgi:hypothetical protein
MISALSGTERKVESPTAIKRRIESVLHATQFGRRRLNRVIRLGVSMLSG